MRTSHHHEFARSVIVTYLQQQQVVRLTFVPERPGFAAKDVSPANVIDEHVFAKLRTMRIAPSQPCSDTDFLRRAHLDIVGVLPTHRRRGVFKRLMQWGMSMVVIAPPIAWLVFVVPEWL